MGPDRESHNSAFDTFQLQSVSKSFTAVALSMLVADGMMECDAPVRQYIPEFEFRGDYLTTHITVRDPRAPSRTFPGSPTTSSGGQPGR